MCQNTRKLRHLQLCSASTWPPGTRLSKEHKHIGKRGMWSLSQSRSQSGRAHAPRHIGVSGVSLLLTCHLPMTCLRHQVDVGTLDKAQSHYHFTKAIVVMQRSNDALIIPFLLLRTCTTSIASGRAHMPVTFHVEDKIKHRGNLRSNRHWHVPRVDLISSLHCPTAQGKRWQHGLKCQYRDQRFRI